MLITTSRRVCLLLFLLAGPVRGALATPDDALVAWAQQSLAGRDAAARIEQGALHVGVRAPDAEAVQLLGAVQLQLAHLEGTPLWVGSVALERPDEAVVGCRFAITRDGSMSLGPAAPAVRGPHAPLPPALADPIQGSVSVYEIGAERLGAPRVVRVYLPPRTEPGEIGQVVFMPDGAAIEQYARVLEPLVLAGTVPPTAIISVAHAPSDPTNPNPAADHRAAEYLIGIHEHVPGMDAERFERHWQFFTRDLVEWARAELGLAVPPARRIVFGFSNGGAFAATVAARAPDQFGAAIALSLGYPGVADHFQPLDRATPQRLCFGAGTYERGFLDATRAVADSARTPGREVRFVERVGGHDQVIWQEQFAAALVWLAETPHDPPS